MEVQNTSEQAKTKISKEKKGSKRTLDPETLKLLGQIKKKVDEKSFGRKIGESEIIAYSLKIIKAEHIKNLQESTLTEQDRLQMIFEEYKKKNGNITMDEFIGKLIRGEVKKML